MPTPGVPQAFPCIGDVARGTPGVSIDCSTPLPNLCHTILAKAIEDVAGLLTQAALHQQVGTHVAGNGLVVGLCPVLTAVAAPVILQVVDTPAVVALCILQLVVDGTEIAAASVVTR